MDFSERNRTSSTGHDGELERLRRERDRLQEELRETRARFRKFTQVSSRFASAMRGRMSERRRLDLQRAVLDALEPAPVDEVPRKFLEVLGQELEPCLGVFWMAHENTLRCAETWRSSGIECDALEEACRRSGFSRGSGLPGRAWAEARPVRVEILAEVPSDPRLEVAIGDGLRDAVAFPIRNSGRLIGIAEFFGQGIEASDEGLSRTLAILGNQVAQVIGRKRAEEALREREKELRAFVSATSDTVYEMSADWREMRSLEGKEFLATTEDPRSDWAGEYIPETDRPRVRAAISKAIQTRSDFELEHRIVRLDGTTGWTFSHAVPLLDEAGEIVKWFGAARDITERKRAEEAVRQSETKYRTLFETIDEGFCVIDLIDDDAGEAVDYRFVEVNRVFERQTGVENVAGKTDRELDLNTEPHWLEKYDEVARTGEPLRVENHHESTGRWYQAHVSRVGGDGSRRVAIVFDNITERKQRERQQEFLLELSDALRSLSDAAEIEETACRLLGEHLGVDRVYYSHLDEAEEGWRVEREYLRGTSPSMIGTYPMSAYGWALPPFRRGEPVIVEDIYHSDIIPPAYVPVMEAIQTSAIIAVPLVKEGVLISVFSATENAPRCWERVEVELVRETLERTWAAVERARTEQALRDGEERLRLAQRAARSGTWEWDLQSDEIRWSDEHRELFGFDPECPITRERWWEAVHPDDVARLEKAGRRCREEGAEWPETEYRITRQDTGERRWINARGRTVRDAAGHPVRILGISVDITERKKADEERDRLRALEVTARTQAAERERLSRDLHDRVAHEMGIVHQSLQLYEAISPTDPDRAAEKIEVAKRMAKSALESTRNLSAELRRSEAEESLEKALREYVEAVAPQDVELAFSFDGDESPIVSHIRGQLYLILCEAIRNSVKHSRCRTMNVDVEVLPTGISASVQDDGLGFEVDGRVDEGVGLRSMRERAELLGGELRLTSAPENGTKVGIIVPFGEEQS